MPRPNPTQVERTNEQDRRRLLATLLPPDRALDERDARLLMDQGNQTSRANVWRRETLALAWQDNRHQLVLSQAELAQLEAYAFEEGDAPSWITHGDRGGERRGFFESATAGQTPPAPAPEPKEDPTEPGRYVRPSGRFAAPGDPEYAPDPR